MVETKKELLSDETKEYLGAAIKPFKNKITKIEYVMKDKKSVLSELNFYSYANELLSVTNLYKMFDGLELGKEYSMKDLGLEERKVVR